MNPPHENLNAAPEAGSSEPLSPPDLEKLSAQEVRSGPSGHAAFTALARQKALACLASKEAEKGKVQYQTYLAAYRLSLLGGKRQAETDAANADAAAAAIEARALNELMPEIAP